MVVCSRDCRDRVELIQSMIDDREQTIVAVHTFRTGVAPAPRGESIDGSVILATDSDDRGMAEWRSATELVHPGPEDPLLGHGGPA